MSKPIFFDTNVLLDFLLDRAPHSIAAKNLIKKAELGEIKIFVSALCFSHIHYILRKIVGKETSIDLLNQLDKIVEIQSVDQTVIRNALSSSFNDFEDAIQNFCAEQAGAAIFVTSNVKDFKASSLSVYTPTQTVKILV